MKTAMDLVAAAKAQVAEIPVADAEAAIRDADVLLDVREAEEFAAGHLPGAVHASRGLARGQIFDRQGRLVASSAQATCCAWILPRWTTATAGCSVARAS